MATFEPVWERAFLTALARCGVATVAAKAAGTGVANAHKRRRNNATFAAAWEAAVAVHRAEQGRRALQAAADEGLAYNLAPDGGKRLRAGQSRWTVRAEEAFLSELTACANVRLAAASAGFSAPLVYKRRLKDRHFAAAWDAALESGRARVQAYLVEAATRTFDPDELPVDDERELPRVSVGEAINIARLKGPGGEAPAAPPAVRIATPAEAEKALIERLKHFAARVQREDVAKGWSVHEGRSIPPGWVKAEEARCVECGGACSGPSET